MADEPKFHRLHYNLVAKRLRERYPDVQNDPDMERVQIERRTIEDIALAFAKAFAKDNPDFDPYQFLDQCSPDAYIYPLSELWEEAHDRA